MRGVTPWRAKLAMCNASAIPHNVARRERRGWLCLIDPVLFCFLPPHRSCTFSGFALAASITSSCTHAIPLLGCYTLILAFPIVFWHHRRVEFRNAPHSDSTISSSFARLTRQNWSTISWKRCKYLPHSSSHHPHSCCPVIGSFLADPELVVRALNLTSSSSPIPHHISPWCSSLIAWLHPSPGFSVARLQKLSLRCFLYHATNTPASA
jgi:hypothetical protein